MLRFGSVGPGMHPTIIMFSVLYLTLLGRFSVYDSNPIKPVLGPPQRFPYLINTSGMLHIY